MSHNKNIVVIGSINTDMVVMTKYFPAPGETILADSFFTNLGGKGANQAVAAARLGATVTLVSNLGDDLFGNQAINQLSKENIDVSLITKDEYANSGIALITVDENAENTIVVASGANALLSFNNIKELDEKINNNSIVVMQLEIPLGTIEQVALFSKSKHATIILNPAPAQLLDAKILNNIDILTPNQAEAKLLSGVIVSDEKSAHEAALCISKLGPKIVIITMGAKGAYVYDSNTGYLVPGYKVNAVDTTAAGDIFNGSLAVALSQFQPLKEAVIFATKASALSVTKAGAQSSAPMMEDITLFFDN
ncbi:ribokinase [Sphingobacterium bovistauri]|uniref:Ribokinase n=1 Tax=Sphingobacterium bovistauri TaxID=2781959 RepID=A0ABS7ZBH9_9SPHI|nr:ribokinase [Sphingobacterium bovistauri]MCA5006279.1 ribokinase [Sphingobacterium bovistauri]